jgi:hypothetical protein
VASLGSGNGLRGVMGGLRLVTGGLRGVVGGLKAVAVGLKGVTGSLRQIVGWPNESHELALVGHGWPQEVTDGPKGVASSLRRGGGVSLRVITGHLRGVPERL